MYCRPIAKPERVTYSTATITDTVTSLRALRRQSPPCFSVSCPVYGVPFATRVVVLYYVFPCTRLEYAARFVMIILLCYILSIYHRHLAAFATNTCQWFLIVSMILRASIFFFFLKSQLLLLSIDRFNNSQYTFNLQIFI